jgi:hypothetical protein
LTNKIKLKKGFQTVIFTKKYDSLFWNTIKDLEYQEIQFDKPAFKNEDSTSLKAYRVRLSPQEVDNVTKYANGLQFIKEQSSECIEGKKTSYEKEIPYYLQGFIAEYAFIKLGLHLGLDIVWKDHLVSHGKGDDGDARINNTIIDIKSKNYKVPYHDLHYDITTSGKASYFVFAYVENQEDGSTYVDILGYHDKKYIKNVEKKEYWSPTRRRSYKARRIKYTTLNSIEDFFNLSF